jgi:hypothetical protein
MTRKKMHALLAILTMAMVGLITGGATYAIFTDYASYISSYQHTSGKINITKDGDGPMFYTSISHPGAPNPYNVVTNYTPSGDALGGYAPGDTVIRTMDLHNEGNLGAVVTQIKAEVNNAGLTSGIAYEEFIDMLNIKVTYDSGTGDMILYNGPLSGLLDGWVYLEQSFLIPRQATAEDITFEAHLDLQTSNEIQDKTFVFDFWFFTEQRRNHIEKPGKGEEIGDFIFLPPFSNNRFTLHQDSTVPIKFQLKDLNDAIETSPRQGVRAVVSGPGENGTTVSYQFAMSDSTLQFNGQHYQFNFANRDYPVLVNETYKVSVYDGDQLICEREFLVLKRGNRSNAP